MIVDTSAVIAILNRETDARLFADAMESAANRSISAVNYVEAAVVVDSARNPIASRRFDEFCREAELEIVPLTHAQAQIAREAYRDFGKGRGRKAKLNLGDCFAYALAKETGEPLLFKGRDFIHTDVEPAL